MKRTLIPLLAAGFLVLAAGCPPRDPNPPPPDDPGNGKSDVEPPPVLPQSLQIRIDEAIKNVRSRDLLTTHAFWTIFHGILGLGPDVDLVDPLNQKRVNA